MVSTRCALTPLEGRTTAVTVDGVEASDGVVPTELDLHNCMAGSARDTDGLDENVPCVLSEQPAPRRRAQSSGVASATRSHDELADFEVEDGQGLVEVLVERRREEAELVERPAHWRTHSSAPRELRVGCSTLPSTTRSRRAAPMR